MKIIKKITTVVFFIFILAFSSLIFSGCGTMMGQTPHQFIINSTPEHANVALNNPNLIIGQTPTSLKLIHHWHFQWTNTHQIFIFSKKGYKVAKLFIYIVPNTAANLEDLPLDFLTFGLSGWVDTETGADYQIWNQAKLCYANSYGSFNQCEKVTINPQGFNIKMLPLNHLEHINDIAEQNNNQIKNLSNKIIVHEIFLHLPPKYKRVYKFSVNNDAKIAGSFKSKNKINLFIFTKHEYHEFLNNSGSYDSIYDSGHVDSSSFSKKLNNGKYYLVLYNGNKSRSTTISITKHIIIYNNNLISNPKIVNDNYLISKSWHNFNKLLDKQQ